MPSSLTAVIGASAVFAGPAGAWAVAGVGLCLVPLTPGNLIIHLRKLEDAGYLSSEKTRNGTVSATTVVLTGRGRRALTACTQALRDLLGGL